MKIFLVGLLQIFFELGEGFEISPERFCEILEDHGVLALPASSVRYVPQKEIKICPLTF